jgi:branched-chain amino acid aminotransferase
MPDFINYNGNIVSEDEPVITADNRSFQYGDGIFETIRISNGNILFFDDHFDRNFSIKNF